MICPVLVADDLSGFWRSSKPGDRDATRGTDGEVYRGTGALSRGTIELWGGRGAAGDQRAALPASSRPLRGGGGGRVDRSAARGGGPDRVRRRAIPDTLLGFQSEALPRGAGGRARVCSRLHLDQGGLAEPRPGAGGGQALGASQKAATPATAGDDAVSGRFDPRVAGRSAGARSGRHVGRCHQRDLLGHSGRGGRDSVELSGAV